MPDSGLPVTDMDYSFDRSLSSTHLRFREPGQAQLKFLKYVDRIAFYRVFKKGPVGPVEEEYTVPFEVVAANDVRTWAKRLYETKSFWLPFDLWMPFHQHRVVLE
jgi:hypothetical protein